MVRKTAVLLFWLCLACGGADAPEPGARIDATRARSSARGTARVPAADRLAGAGRAPEPGEDGRRAIVFLGTSLTAGYGLDTGRAFPALIQQKIDSAGLPFRVVNAGSSGETSAGGLRRLDWALQQPVDVLVIELGANDGLRGLPVEQMRANLDSIIVRTRARYPDAAVVIAGMEAPPNLGRLYTTAFSTTFEDLARLRDTELIPFLLEGVGGIPELNQDDGIHPTADGHRIVAENVWRILGPVLAQRAAIE